ncbi:MAG: membrane protein insertase YidC [Bacteroidales bacterium]
MDKNTLIGFVLIFLIIIGFSLLNKPSQEQLDAAQAQQRQRDSIALVEAANQARIQENAAQTSDSTVQTATDTSQSALHYGVFAPFTQGEKQLTTFENDLLELQMSSKGGRIASVRLKEFVTHDSLPLFLYDEQVSDFGFSFFTADNRLIHTQELYFQPVEQTDANAFVYRLALNEDTWMDFVYRLQPGDYRVKFDLQGHNLQSVLPVNTRALDFNWAVKMRQQEKGRQFEERYSGLNYKFAADDVEKLSESKDETANVANTLKWVSFKDQFFACIAIADQGFNSNILTSKVEPKTSAYIKDYALTSSLDFDLKGNQQVGMQFYFGPIKHQLLKRFDKDVPADQQLNLDKIVPLGGSFIRWANTGVILPMFNLFGRFINNYGLIILLMTLVIKIFIFPLTYKSYISSAKMRVLQPQITEINERFAGTEKAQERSQATMELYRKAGVNPMGGCLPMLFQMPILFAMYSFFPSSIELRQESFLWATDLSTYDAVLTWSGNIPLVTKYFGNHLSLFCLLMTITNIVYTHVNMKSQPTNNQMPGMKTMMYIMPVMFLFIFNQYSAALSFYFFVSTLITILQTYLFRLSINEEKLLLQLNENKKKPKKKSGFAARLEEMQKQQQRALKEQQKKRK